MELVVRQHFQKNHVATLTPVEMVEAITNDEDVAFYWCLVAVDMDTSTANHLLHTIVEIWITIHGFSFCSGPSGWMELFTNKKLKNQFNILKAYARHYA